jgi:uncharacterized protein (TIGR00369 family)
MKLDNPLLEHLGVELVEWGTGTCELRLDIAAHHLNRQASLQGGVVATLLDAACGYAGLRSSDDAAPDNALTVMLTISYLAKVQRGRITAIGRVTGGGRTLYFASAELRADDGRLVATAQGSFKRLPSPSPSPSPSPRTT